MAKSRKLIWAALSLVLLVQSSARSGEVINMQCDNKDCRQALEFQLGGGMLFEQVTGYCSHCKKIVTLTWTSPHALQAGAPVPMSRPSRSGSIFSLLRSRVIFNGLIPRAIAPFWVIWYD
jgi:hypothetical protein